MEVVQDAAPIAAPVGASSPQLQGPGYRGCLLLLGALLATIKNTRMGPNSRFLRKRCFSEFFPVPRSHACLDLSLGHLRKLSHLRGRFGPTFDRETLEALIVIRK